MSKKSLGDEFADHLIQGALRGAAKGVASVVRRGAAPLGKLLEGLDKLGSCECTPEEHVIEGADGPETVTLHRKGCPAR